MVDAVRWRPPMHTRPAATLNIVPARLPLALACTAMLSIGTPALGQASTGCDPNARPGAERVIAKPATDLLPASGDAKILFHQPPRASGDFLVLDVPPGGGASGLDPDQALPVVSFEPAPAGVAGYPANSSVLLTLDLARVTSPMWSRHTFLVLACDGGKTTGWAYATAEVSDPEAADVICTVLFVAIYLLAMIAVIASSRSRNTIIDRYPSVFGTRILSWRDIANPIHLAPDAFTRASVQKLQFVMFSFLVGWLVLSMALRTGALTDLSTSVLTLLGVSGVGAAAAQAVHQQKARLSLENWAWLEQRHVLKRPTPPPGPRWRDLVLTNRSFDIYKLQTIIFSVAVAVALIADGATNLADFTVPETLLGVLGLSQVVYLGGVMAQPPTIADLDTALTRLRLANERLAEAKLRGIDTGQDGNLLAALPADGKPGENAQRQYLDLARGIVPMIESALEVEVDQQALGMPAVWPPLAMVG